jgi:hypothetical protein
MTAATLNNMQALRMPILCIWTAISLVLISVACAGRSWEETPAVADLSVPRPCNSTDLAPIWTDSLRLVTDTSLQHVVAGGSALEYPSALRLENRSGLVRARFAIDTAGHVIPGSGIIEASSDDQFARAVCYALPQLQFAPVVLDGHKTVAGLIHVPFTFGVK